MQDTIAITAAFVGNLDFVLSLRGITKTQLSKMTGIAKPDISRLFRAGWSTSLHTMATISAALDVPVQELLGAIAVDGGVVSAGRGIDEPGKCLGTITLSKLIPNGTTAYVVSGESMVDEHILDGDYIFIRKPDEQPPEIGDKVVVFVPDMGTLIKVKVKGGYIGSAPGAKLIPWVDGCHEYGVLVGSFRPTGGGKKRKRK